MAETNRIARACAAVACLVLSLAPVRGDDDTRRFEHIDIILNGASCRGAPAEIFVTVYDGAGQEYTATRVGGENRWRVATLKRRLPAGVRASVRWETKRTPCSKAASTDSRNSVLTFTFSDCTSDTGRDYQIMTDQRTVATAYERRLTFGNGECAEWGSFMGVHDLALIQLNLEEVRLDFGTTAPPTVTGLLLNKLEYKKGKAFLTRDKVAHQLAVQRLKGNSAPPTTSPTALEIDAAKLHLANLKSVTLRW